MVYQIPKLPGQSEGVPPPRTGAEFVAGQFSRDGNSPIERLGIYEQRLDRALHAAIRELNMLRKLRRDCRTHEEDDPMSSCAPGTDETSAHPQPVAAQEPAGEAHAPVLDGTIRHIVQNKATAERESSDHDAERAQVDAADGSQHPPS
jgi:hypothetical protein